MKGLVLVALVATPWAMRRMFPPNPFRAHTRPRDHNHVRERRQELPEPLARRWSQSGVGNRRSGLNGRTIHAAGFTVQTSELVLDG
jgi:hypothetical protein